LLSGFDPFVGLAAGDTHSGLMIGLDSTTIGMFSGRIVLHPKSVNPQPFSMDLPSITIDLIGGVTAVPEPSVTAFVDFSLIALLNLRRPSIW